MKRLKRIVHLLREATGQNAYERYCEHLRTHHPDRPAPSASEFYRARQNDQYSRPNRCC